MGSQPCTCTVHRIDAILPTPISPTTVKCIFFSYNGYIYCYYLCLSIYHQLLYAGVVKGALQYVGCLGERHGLYWANVEG